IAIVGNAGIGAAARARQDEQPLGAGEKLTQRIRFHGRGVSGLCGVISRRYRRVGDILIAVAPAGSILVGGLVIVITGIAAHAMFGRRRANAALRAVSQQSQVQSQAHAAELAEVTRRLSQYEQRLEEMTRERKGTETRLREQLMRFALLDRITRAI